MAHENHGGTSPLARMRSRLDETRRTCEECGYEDTEGSWTATTDGRRVTFEHVCPSCAATDRYVVRMGPERGP